MYQTIITEVDGAIGILTLNKIERHNALDENLIAELTNGLLALESDPAVRVVVLSATGKSFCAGSDINWMKRAAVNAPSERLRDERNCLGVEMESFALFHNAKVLGKNAACVVTISDSFVAPGITTAEQRQTSFTEMMKVALGVDAYLEQ